MFPLDSNDAYRNDDGSLTTLGNKIGSGGGGGSYTPDYENNRLIIGQVGDYLYYAPLSKEYVGIADQGYEISTNPSSSSSSAKIDIYDIKVVNGEIVDKTLITTLVHNDTSSYSNDDISVSYTGTNWQVQSSKTFKDLDTGDAVTFPVNWSYSTTVDYTWYIPTT